MQWETGWPDCKMEITNIPFLKAQPYKKYNIVKQCKQKKNLHHTSAARQRLLPDEPRLGVVAPLAGWRAAGGSLGVAVPPDLFQEAEAIFRRTVR